MDDDTISRWGRYNLGPSALDEEDMKHYQIRRVAPASAEVSGLDAGRYEGSSITRGGQKSF